MTLQLGSNGEAVNIMQRQLNAAGYNCAVSGTFDMASDTAVRRFQTDHQLVVDGRYGPDTQSALELVLRREWLAYTSVQVSASTLPGSALSDGISFSAQFTTLGPQGRIQFWSQLILAMMSFESDYDPGDVYREKDGTLSIGLLQLSYTDPANYKLDFPLNEGTNDLKDPKKNIELAVLIMARLVARDQCLSRQVGDAWKGVSAYWGTLRTDTPEHITAFNGIQTIMKGLVFTQI